MGLAVSTVCIFMVVNSIGLERMLAVGQGMNRERHLWTHWRGRGRLECRNMEFGFLHCRCQIAAIILCGLFVCLFYFIYFAELRE